MFAYENMLFSRWECEKFLDQKQLDLEDYGLPRKHLCFTWKLNFFSSMVISYLFNFYIFFELVFIISFLVDVLKRFLLLAKLRFLHKKHTREHEWIGHLLGHLNIHTLSMVNIFWGSLRFGNLNYFVKISFGYAKHILL